MVHARRPWTENDVVAEAAPRREEAKLAAAPDLDYSEQLLVKSLEVRDALGADRDVCESRDAHGVDLQAPNRRSAFPLDTRSSVSASRPACSSAATPRSRSQNGTSVAGPRAPAARCKRWSRR